MNWTGRSTWNAVGILLLTYLVFALVGYLADGASGDIETGMALVYGPLFVVNPLVTIVLAVRDAMKNGLGLLWMFVPFLCFLIPAYVIYGGRFWKLGLSIRDSDSLPTSSHSRSAGPHVLRKTPPQRD